MPPLPMPPKLDVPYECPKLDVPYECFCGVCFVVIAVGTAIAGCPPHRSVREELPHTAPTLSRA